MRKPIKLTFIFILLLPFAMLILYFTRPTQAETNTITIGPWTFEDQAFADDATDLSGDNQYQFKGLDFFNDTICTYEANYQNCLDLVLTEDVPGFFTTTVPLNEVTFLGNIGTPGSNSNWFQLDFTDIKAENNLGADIVFFECHYSGDNDSFEFAVRPEGGAFTDFILYEASRFRETDVPCEGNIGYNWGIPINLSDFGLVSGTIVDALQFKSVDPLDPKIFAEGDPTMAAVLKIPPNMIFLPITVR